MLRVVIADDEARICKLIQALADWQRLGMEVVGVAGNGVEALALIHALQPDILITDIRMPGRDGMDVIQQAKAALPSLEVIIISGYAQFDYARTAIQYGVGEYLLKPINRENLNATLERMGDRCRARKAAAMDVERLRSSARNDVERSRNSLIPDLLSGRYAASTGQDLLRSYHFSSQDDHFQTLVLKIDYDTEHFTAQSLEIVSNKVAGIFTPILSACCADFLLSCQETAVYGVMNYPSGQQSALRHQLRDGLNQLVAMQSLFGPVQFSMALGIVARHPGDLPASMENAQTIIAERLLEGTGRLLEGRFTPSSIGEAALLARYEQDASHAIDALDEREAEHAATALEQAAVSVPHVHGSELLSLARGAAMLFLTRLGIKNREQILRQFDAACGQCDSVSKLFQRLRALQAAQLQAAREQRQNQDGQPVRMAKQYMQKHHAEPLTLEDVSAAVGFSANYFSTLFKKETGEGFAKYLIRVRIEAAKGLLRETTLPVQEICKRVGYGDIKHFIRVFRAETSLTPSEFRKLYG